jgi:hypothetical protein
MKAPTQLYGAKGGAEYPEFWGLGTLTISRLRGRHTRQARA